MISNELTVAGTVPDFPCMAPWLLQFRPARARSTGFPFNLSLILVKEPNSLAKVNNFVSCSTNWGIVLHLGFVDFFRFNALAIIHIVAFSPSVVQTGEGSIRPG